MRPPNTPPRWARGAPWLSALLALGLALPTLWLGLSTVDDGWQQQLILDRIAGRGGADPWYAIFNLVDVDATTAVAQRMTGARPWWALDDVRIRLFRPLAALTHYVDNLLFPGAPWAMHLHSVFWYAVLCALLTRLYQRLWPAGEGRAWPVLAACLYAADEAHIEPVAWIAHRNALVATTLCVLALLLHVGARRDGSRRAYVGSLLAWTAALATAERALGGLGLLVGYALWLDRGPLRVRVGALLPHLGLCLTYLGLYRTLGFGAHHSGMYVDPLGDPLGYLRGVPEHLWLLLCHHSTVSWPLHSGLLPAPLVRAGLWLTLLLLAPALVVFAGRRIGRDPLTAFSAGAGLLALAPALALPPHERLLLLPGVPLWLLSTRLLQALWEAARAPHHHGLPRALAALLGALWLLLHGLVAPVALAVGGARYDAGSSAPGAHVPGLDRPPLPPDGRAVVLSAPSLFSAQAIGVERARAGLPVPARLHVLGATPDAVRVSTLDPHTLLLETPLGFVREPQSRFWRSPSVPLRVGQRIETEDFTVHVVAVTVDGYPRAVRVRFTIPVRDARLRFLAFYRGRFGPLRPPPVGGALLLPAFGDPRMPPPRPLVVPPPDTR